MAPSINKMPGFDRKIASILVKSGKITTEQADEFQSQSKKNKTHIEAVLFENEILDEAEYLATLAEEIQISPINLMATTGL